jgi:hypothetical protein
LIIYQVDINVFEIKIWIGFVLVYILQIRTGDKPFAGTDSVIQVTIRGSKSQTRRLALTSDRANLFERNQLDTFAIVGWDIGDLLEIT